MLRLVPALPLFACRKAADRAVLKPRSSAKSRPGMLELLRSKACCNRRPGLPCGKAGDVVPMAADPANFKTWQVAEESRRLMGAKTPADAEKAVSLRERGNELFKKQDFEAALAVYMEAVALQPRDPAIWLNLSITHRQLRNWEHAEEEAEVASELQPTNAKAHYARAVALQQLGRLQDALAVSRKGLEQQADHKPLRQLLSAIERSLEQQSQRENAAVEEQPKKEQGNGSGKDAACPVARLKDNDHQRIREQGEKAAYEWKGRNPSDQERLCLKNSMVGMFRDKYIELKAAAQQAESHRSTLQTDQYDPEQKIGLKLKGGHQPMKRPENVDLPSTYRQPMGVISLDELGKFDPSNQDRRYLLSIYGDVFDVSDRPDKYGPDGPYNELTGKDITWGMFTGVDQPEMCNRCYDLFKAKDQGTDKLAGLCSWLGWYETEYGVPVARLEPYTHERDLPAPPLEEVGEACAVM